MSDQTQTIDILIAVDAETILSKFSNNLGSQDNPTHTLDQYLRMIARHNNTLLGIGNSGIDIKAEIGNNVRWRAASLSINFDYDVLIYRFSNPPLTQGQNLGYISVPEALDGTIQEPVLNPDNPSQPVFREVTNYYWQSTIKKTGIIGYNFHFMITGRNGKVYGYFQGGGLITVLH
ncbi:MAG: aidA [bacterium]|nr:MAG: aidA [bacterium]